MCALQLASKAGGHDVQRGEGFAGVAEQGLGVDVGKDCEYGTDGSRLLLTVSIAGYEVFGSSVFEGQGVRGNLFHLQLLARF